MPDLLDHLHTHFGLRDFRPSQREVIQDVLAGRDVLCVMPTGAGKSLCYQLPAVVGGGLTVVVSPLISLMDDQVRQLRQRNIESAFLNSSQSAAEQRDVLRRVAGDGGSYSGLLYVAPERFFGGGFTSFLKQHDVQLLAIDEAHCVSQWGHDFRPDYSRLGRVREELGEPVTIALTATATDDVRQDIVRSLHLRDPQIYVTGFDRPNLSYEARVLEKKAHKPDALHEIINQNPGSGIVYCATRRAVDEVTGALSDQFPGRAVFAYHAGMDAGARQSNQERFMATAGAIAVATNAFGMGINKPDIRWVVHYNLPGTLEAYYQEAGRAGRDGAESRCVILYHFGDRKTQEFFIDNIGRDRDDQDPEVIDELKGRATAKLDLMVRYARSARCRREQILEYFGDEQEARDCTCDVCRGEAGGEPAVPMTPETILLTQKMLSAVARMRGQFGLGAVAEVLAGIDNERAQRWRLNELSVFGLLSDYPPKQLVAMLHRLVEAGLVRQRDPDQQRRPIIEITLVGIDVMKGQKSPPAVLGGLATRGRRTGGGSGGAGRAGSSNTAAGAGTSGNPTRTGSSSSTISGRAATVLGGRTVPDAEDHASPEEEELDPQTQDRLARLKTVRTSLAKEASLPSYCICHDKTLKLIARDQPGDVEALERIKGMGPHKVRMYGDKLLAALQAVAG